MQKGVITTHETTRSISIDYDPACGFIFNNKRIELDEISRAIDFFSIAGTSMRVVGDYDFTISINGNIRSSRYYNISGRALRNMLRKISKKHRNISHHALSHRLSAGDVARGGDNALSDIRAMLSSSEGDWKYLPTVTAFAKASRHVPWQKAVAVAMLSQDKPIPVAGYPLYAFGSDTWSGELSDKLNAVFALYQHQPLEDKVNALMALAYDTSSPAIWGVIHASITRCGCMPANIDVFMSLADNAIFSAIIAGSLHICNLERCYESVAAMAKYYYANGDVPEFSDSILPDTRRALASTSTRDVESWIEQ